MSVTLNGTSGLTFGDGTTQPTAGYASFRNRFINGNMLIDQRYAGTLSTYQTTGNQTGGDGFTLDRIKAYNFRAGGSTLTAQQTVDAPAGSGLIYSVKYINTTGATTAATDNVSFWQPVEGYFVSDFLWGTTSAKTATLSFWVKSSTAGTFGVSFRNSAANRSYVATYTISAANTWEYKQITVAGDTTGSWNIGNGVGIYVAWDLGIGSNFQTATTGAWQAGNYITATSTTKIAATTGASIQFTGIQLELGSYATPFENRNIGVEYMLCRRYYQQSSLIGNAKPAAGVNSARTGIASSYGNTTAESCVITFNVPMRAVPAMQYFRPSHSTGNDNAWAMYINGTSWAYTTSGNGTSIATENYFSTLIDVTGKGSNNGTSGITEGSWIANAEL